MADLGSFPERKEFFRSEAKPPRRFWDRAGPPLMTVDGGKDDSLLTAGDPQRRTYLASSARDTFSVTTSPVDCQSYDIFPLNCHSTARSTVELP